METLLALTIRPTLAWMGKPYDSPEAARMLACIAQTESSCLHRRQISGPARSWWQCEPPTLHDLLKRWQLGVDKLTALGLYPAIWDDPRTVLEWSETAGCVVARGLLWLDPHPLPTTAEDGLATYLRVWRPGRPHPERFTAAWAALHESV